MFNNASTLEISGGTFASIGRDAYFGQLSVTAGGDVHISVAPTGNAAHLSHQVAATTRETKAHRRTSSIPTGPPDAFAHVETWLQALSHCLAPTSKKSFRTLRSHLKDIESLSTFSRTLYEISNDSAVERIIKQRIEMRLQRCGQMLQGIHRRIAALPCWWIFMIKFAYGEAFAEWLTSNGREPEELQSIQGELAAEVNSFGKCVRSMQHLDKWPWGPQMWCSLTAQTPFSTGLDTFLRVSGPSWIHDIVIEEIIILEPIKGSPWSVPLVFVETIETGSRNTISSHYIEGGQYQLNESETNATVDENSLPDFLRHKNVLEVTIRIRAPAAAQQDGCPGCGLPSDVIGAQQEGAWVRCACMMQYSQTLISQETGRPPSPTPRARKESGGDIDRLNDADWDASSKQGTSVSADVTEGMAASGRAQKTIEDRMLNPSFTPSTIAPPSAFRRLTIETVQFSPETQANIEVINDDGLDGGSVVGMVPGDLVTFEVAEEPASISAPASVSTPYHTPRLGISRTRLLMVSLQHRFMTDETICGVGVSAWDAYQRDPHNYEFLDRCVMCRKKLLKKIKDRNDRGLALQYLAHALLASHQSNTKGKWPMRELEEAAIIASELYQGETAKLAPVHVYDILVKLADAFFSAFNDSGKGAADGHLLESSISWYWKASTLEFNLHSNNAGKLGLCRAFLRRKPTNEDELHIAITMLQEASILPFPVTDRHSFLTDIASLLMQVYNIYHEPWVLDKATELQKELYM